jgi:hypothetical protein
MDAEQKKKLERLKAQAHIKEQKQRLQKNVLLQECLDALSFYLILEDEDEIKHIESLVASSHAEMRSHDDKVILEDDERYYIVWDEATLPVVMSTGKNIVECWDDVMAVSFDTYLVSVSTGKTIGIRH